MNDHNQIKSRASFLLRIFDIGVKPEYSATERRYLRITNIAAILGILFMLQWMIMAIYLTDSPTVYGSNGLVGVMFSLVLVFNRQGWRVLASSWFAINAYLGILLFLYLLGYSSGVAAIFFVVIITPFMTFPRKARGLATGFSILGCLTLIVVVSLQSQIPAHFEVMDPFILQLTNIGVTGVICLILAWTLSVLVDRSEESLRKEQMRSDDLLHNILPVKVAKDLKETGSTVPRRYKSVTILFTDFEGFTELVASIPAITLVSELNEIFGRFDEIVEEEGIEKIETIGDAYLSASGLDEEISDHANRCIRAAKKMLAFLEVRNLNHEIKWKMRVGVHSGPIVAGVVGKKKFNYDLFGDTVNTASRMESSGEPGKINISESTYQLVQNEFDFEERGKIVAKGKGELEMYYVK